jgi:hypothetical protein
MFDDVRGIDARGTGREHSLHYNEIVQVYEPKYSWVEPMGECESVAVLRNTRDKAIRTINKLRVRSRYCAGCNRCRKLGEQALVQYQSKLTQVDKKNASFVRDPVISPGGEHIVRTELLDIAVLRVYMGRSTKHSRVMYIVYLLVSAPK